VFFDQDIRFRFRVTKGTITNQSLT
jgi:hypothetical protein